MNQIELFSKIPQSKEEIKTYAKSIKDMFLSGENENLLQFKALKVFESIIKEALLDKEIKKSVLNAAEKYGKNIELYGCEYSICEAGTKYDYSNCNDDILNQLEDAKAKLEEQIKEHQEFLKTIGNKEIYNEQGVRLNAPTKTSETIVKIKIK